MEITIQIETCITIMNATHKVIDLVYHEDEGNEAFTGTYQECLEWKSDQGFGYQIVPLMKEELEHSPRK